MSHERSVQPVPDSPARRRLLTTAALAPLAGLVPACGGGGGISQPVAATRNWQMGFSPNPPRVDVAAVIAGIDLWSRRADLAIIHEETPWTDLLAGMSPDAIIDRDKVDLLAYLRGKGLGFVFMGDLTDGLSRAGEAPQLRRAGRSLIEPAVQALYRRYLLAVARRLQPSVIGLAAETNLIRAAAPAALYAAVVKTANDTATALRSAGVTVTLMVSVQAETAWGRLSGAGPYVGIDPDGRDFAFTQMLGLSSYPYLGYAQPEDLPADCYSRLLLRRELPAMVVEGGWASASGGSVASSPNKQARYIARHAALLDGINARAWLQLQYADIDLASLPLPVPTNLPLFASIGLTDANFAPKPALASWDTLFARRLAA